ncbi:unnamed protein product [Leptidea sinapis]|uniref:Uncharacterized protein n=1 Tax=Leptidea sinapis TaxID=189913 RepID=A0A5E4PN37_9NEOP|nr:unnamed protein product [Leptidea sinapis]
MSIQNSYLLRAGRSFNDLSKLLDLDLFTTPIRQLDEVEYALPASDAPSLEEILNCKQLDISEDGIENKHNEPATCSGLYIEFLQAVSQQVAQAEGHWTEGRVSLAMSRAGETALAGACIVDGILTILGRKGIVRVRLRDVITRSKIFMSSGHYLEALKLLSSTRGTESVMVAREFVATFIEKPHILLTNCGLSCGRIVLSRQHWSRHWGTRPCEGISGAMRELTGYVDAACGVRRGEPCACAGAALVLCAADALAGRSPDQERTLEIIEFLGGQLQNGALPLDQQLIQNIQDLVASIENEKSDRAWIGILMRMRNQRDQLFADYRNHIERPRILWKVDSLIDRHDEAIKQFFDIESPSQQDIDEFFVYIQSIISSSDIRKRLHDFLPKIIELRPGAVAALLTDEQSSGAVADTMRVLRDERALQFGKCLLDMGRLRGEAATVYLRHLCVSEPADVRHFLTKHSGLVRPEDALALVTELGPKDAEPICLEATGDYKGALDALLNTITEDDQERVAMEACELCVRVCGTVPRADGQEMWTRLLRHLPAVPPALVFEAFAYLPLEELLSKTVNSVQVRRILADGANGLAAWECAKRIAGVEAHEALARSLVEARRGIAVRAPCVRCGEKLDSRVGIRTAHCSRAYHADCDVYPICHCGKRLPTNILNLPPSLPHSRQLDNPLDSLQVVAPPRPDLEGVV